MKRVSFSDDNAHVITVSGNDLIRLWDISDGHMIAVFPGFDATFDHYGQLAIVVSENVTRFWTPFLPTQNLQDEAYRRVRQLDPEQRKQFALKVAEKSSANRQTPENFLLDYHKLGDIYMDTGEVEEAVKAYQQQTKIKPQDGDAWNDLGDALRHQDKLEEAKKAFAAGLKAQSTHLRLLSNDAELALIQGDITRLQDRIKKIPKEEIRNQQLSVILPFLAWLAHPKQAQAWEELKEALQQLPPEVPINWDFSNIDPVIAHLAPSSQQRAQYLVTFFKRWNKPQTRISPQILIEQLDAIQ